MLASPLYYDKLLGRTIDLSQLVEVTEPFFLSRETGHDYKAVGFHYRYAQTPVKEMCSWSRLLREGPPRNNDLTLVDPSKQLLTLGEECYYVCAPPMEPGGGVPPRGGNITVIDPETDEPICLTYMQHEVDKLIAAWQKWKAVEPEIYAIIKKHLS
jgi:hypothetical protein